MNRPALRYRYRLETAILVLTILTGASTLVTAQAPPADLQNLLYGRDIFYDADGLIVHKTPDGQPDGGDTAQREGWYWLGVWIRQNTPGLPPWGQKRELSFDQVLRLLEPNGDGVFYRHPKQPPFNNPHDKKFGFSRDQMIPLVAAGGMGAPRCNYASVGCVTGGPAREALFQR